MYPRSLVTTVVALGFAAVAMSGVPAVGQAPRPGGVLNVTQREDSPQGFAIHETSTISTVWPAMPCLSNLVIFDPLKQQESAESVVGELAEKWAWQDGNRSLVLSVRKNVKWHDGQPFTSKDVKFTFDMVRGAPDAGKLRINPRKGWYENVEAIEAPDPHTVVFRLKRPQPSLLLMLASGYSPVYAAHVPPAQYRTTCVGTGPFKVKEWRKGEFIDYVKNPDYFIEGRPYLDGMRYVVIKERGTRVAALQAGQVDVSFPGDMSPTSGEQLKNAVPGIVVRPTHENVNNNIIMNMKKPPFDNAKVRLAVSHAIDRRALTTAVHQGGGVVGAAMAPKPHGVWGLPEKELLALPGYGTDPAEEKEKARRILRDLGFTPQNPLRVEMATRAIAIYVDMASFVINELKQVGIEATLKQVETAQWHAMATRGDYQIGANLTGIGPDDPDANFYENYVCGSPRNYSFYCSEQVEKMIEQQSAELDPAKRMRMVWDIQKRLEQDAARPMLNWRLDHFTTWPKVKNLVPHQSLYNWGRMQEVWLDR